MPSSGDQRPSPGVFGSYESARPAVEGFSPEGSVEVSKSESSVLYDNPDGTHTMVVSDGPARYRDGGVWREIDLTLEPDGQGGFAPAAAPERVRIGRDGLAHVPVAGGDLVLDVPGRTTESQGRFRAGRQVPRSDEPASRAADAGGGERRAGDEVVFDGPRGEVEVTALVNGVKTTHVIAEPGAEVLETLRLPRGWSARQADGVIELVDPSGNVAAGWVGGAVTDSATVPAETTATMQLIGVSPNGTVTARAVVDSAWLGAPERVWPVQVDPTVSRSSGASGAGDSYVQANIANTSQWSSGELKVGRTFDGLYLRQALVGFQPSIASTATVLDASMDLYALSSASCTEKKWVIHPNLQTWGSSTVWNSKPVYEAAVAAENMQTRGYTGCPGGWLPDPVDLTALTQSWVNGTRTNYGMTIKAEDESSNLGGKTFASSEYGFAPTLTITYNSGPGKPALLSPAADEVVTSRTPTLSSTGVTDPDGETVNYRFQVSSGANIVADSGWLTGTSWTVPDGSLEDGGTYSWTVTARDTPYQFETPSDPRSMKVDLRLGMRPALPYDPAGPVQVNLATGNVVAGMSSPSIPFVGGTAGVSFTYNAQAEPRTGLTGAYHPDTDQDGVIDPGEAAAVVRRDAMVHANWGAGAPFPGLPIDRFNVRWTGFFTAPVAATYTFGGSFDDALKVTVNENVVYDKVGVYATENFDGAVGVPLAAGERVPIQVDYRELVGDARVSLFVTGPFGLNGAPAPMAVPTSWLSPDAPALPQGWQVSADLDGGSGWSRATVAADQVTLVDAAGTAWVWKASAGGGFTPPKDQDGVLARDDTGRLTLHDSDGQVYVFNEQGRVAAVTTPADDRYPAALTYTWEGSPARLTTITDPVSQLVGVRLRYRGYTANGQSGDGCSTTAPTGLAAAPSGLLCALEYPDGNSTVLWYTPGATASAQLARIVDPGDEVTDLAYTSGRLSTIRDALAADAVAAGVRADDDTTRTLITYDSAGRAATVTLPDPTVGAPRPKNTYDYQSGATRVLRDGGSTASSTTFAYGAAGYLPVVGNWDANTTDTVGVYIGDTWHLRNSNTPGSADITPFAYGASWYKPIVGDWNNDNRDTVGLFDTANANFYLRNTNSAGSPDIPAFAFGDKTWTPLVGDWDGNGTDTIGVYSTDTFYLRNTNNGGAANYTISWAIPGATPIVGDWDGNGTTTIGLRTAAGDYLLRNSNTPGPADLTVRLAGSGTPVTGDYDGNGTSTAGLYTSGTWTQLNSHTPADRAVAFDSAGRVVSDTDATGRSTSATWNAKDQNLTRTDPAGRVTTTAYDTAGRVQTVTGPDPAVPAPATAPKTTTTYDGGIQGLGQAWYANGTLTGSPALHGTGDAVISYTGTAGPPIGPSGTPRTDQWSLRFTGEIEAATTGNHTFGVDSPDNVRLYIDDQVVIDRWTTPPPAVTTKTINLTGGEHRIRIDYRDTDTDGDANSMQLKWDPAGGSNLVPVPIGKLGPRYGLVTRTAVAGGETTDTDYALPHLGLATKTTRDPLSANPSGLQLEETTTYEPHATAGSYLRRTSRTLPAGAGTTVTYSHYGPTETADDPCTGPVEAIPQAGREKTSTAADPDGTGPEGPVVREQRYDLWGRVVASRVGTDPWTCRTSDARGRVLTLQYPAVGASAARTVTSSYAVGANPLVTSVTDPAGTITTTVDLLGRVVSYTDVWNKTTTTAYDQLGRVIQTVGPAGTLAYTYDPAGRVETVRLDGNVIADPAYDTAGETASVTYPSGAGNAGNGTSLTGLTKDASGRATGLTWSLNGSSLSDAVTRNQAGKITAATTDGAASSFGYDGAGRLTAATVPGHTYTYGYGTASCGSLLEAGKNSNRTTMVDNGVTTDYCYDQADRLTATTATGYTGAISYDSHGNTTTLAGETRGYDQADRHLSTIKGSTTVTYTRDALDRIVARNDGTTSVKYAYSASGDTGDATLDTAGTVIERTIGLPGGVLVTKRAGGDVWSYPNLHGDIVATANATGVKQGATMHWGPYGETLTAVPDNSAQALDYGWLGQHQRPLEHQTGLVPTIEMGARQYDPTLGRFLETDPIEGGSANDYDYVAGDPVNGLDLDGRNKCEVGANPVRWIGNAQHCASSGGRSVGGWVVRQLNCATPRGRHSTYCGSVKRGQAQTRAVMAPVCRASRTPVLGSMIPDTSSPQRTFGTGYGYAHGGLWSYLGRQWRSAAVWGKALSVTGKVATSVDAVCRVMGA